MAVLLSAGVASGVNNAVSRAAALLWIAAASLALGGTLGLLISDGPPVREHFAEPPAPSPCGAGSPARRR
jgi:hypothetical protein